MRSRELLVKSIIFAGFGLSGCAAYEKPPDAAYLLRQKCEQDPKSTAIVEFDLIKGQRIQVGGVGVEVTQPGYIKFHGIFAENLDIGSNEVILPGYESYGGNKYRLGFKALDDGKTRLTIQEKCLNPEEVPFNREKNWRNTARHETGPSRFIVYRGYRTK